MPLRSRLAALVGTSAIVFSSCAGFQGRVDRAQLARQDDEYVRVALALGVRDPDSLDFYAGPADWLRAARARMEPLPRIRARASSLAADLARARSSSAETAGRRAFLSRQVAAIIARIDVLTGRRWPFDEESRHMFGVDAGWTDRDWHGYRARIAESLPGSGSPVQRLAALDRRFLVPPERLPAVLARAVEECRRVTRAHVSLPAGEAVELEFVHGAKWPAFTRYEGHGRSRTEIDLDAVLTIDRVLDVACHETYPGHHAINLLLNPRVQPLYSPQSFRTESAASYASRLAFPLEQRLAFERDVLVPLAGVGGDGLREHVRAAALVDGLRWVQADIARRYLDGRLDFARAAQALEDETLMPADALEPTLKFFNEFRTYVVGYTAGYTLVHDQLAGERDEAARWRAYQRWIGT